MDNITKVKKLSELIALKLLPIIGKKCILLDVPYYQNIGDVLIWEGENTFCKKNGIDILYTSSYNTCIFPKVSQDVTICFNGGGNIGDLYCEHRLFLFDILRSYPQNKIIVFPQTVYYQNKITFIEDFTLFSKLNNLYFCARDINTFKLLYPYLQENVILVPDMAFYIDRNSLLAYSKPLTKNCLYLKRNDCEAKNLLNPNNKEVDISDWPVLANKTNCMALPNRFFIKIHNMNIPLFSSTIDRIWDFYANKIFRKSMLMEGVKFISPYKNVETERLHGCILSILLDKTIVLYDNSYGKNKSFYETWLSDLDSVKLLQ